MHYLRRWRAKRAKSWAHQFDQLHLAFSAIVTAGLEPSLAKDYVWLLVGTHVRFRIPSGQRLVLIIAGTILIVVSVIVAVWALLQQKSDHVSGYGSTMGGQMITGQLWLIASALAGAGAGLLSRWFVGIPVALIVYVISFPVRSKLESSLSRSKTSVTDDSSGQD